MESLVTELRTMERTLMVTEARNVATATLNVVWRLTYIFLN